PGSRRGADRVLDRRMARARAVRVPRAAEAHRRRRGVPVEPAAVGRVRLFRRAIRVQAAAAPLVARRRRAVLSDLAAAPLLVLEAGPQPAAPAPLPPSPLLL